MSFLEIIVIVACALIVSSVVIFSLIRRKQGRCSCGCEDCPHFSSCHEKKKK